MPDLQRFRRKIGAPVAAPFVAALRKSGISPNAVTVSGIFITILAAWMAARGSLVASGLILAGASLLDMLDGALARATGKTTRFGAILDSTGDRISEAAMLAGVAWWFSQQGNSAAIVTSYIALIASFLVSYLRARGEAMGFDCTVGLCTRPERVIVLVLGLLTGFLFVAVSVIAFCSSVTVIQRLRHLQRKGKESGD